MEYNNSVDSTTITGTSAADTITNSGDTVRIDSDKGDDKIFNEGVNVSINAGKGDDEVTNIADSVTVDGGAGDDEVINDGDDLYANLGAGDDTLSNYRADNVFIDAGAGDDFIDNRDGGHTQSMPGKNVTINGGTGDDAIYNWGDEALLNGGNGDDYIYTQEISTINPGKGHDTVEFNTAGYEDNILTYNYATGDGDDVIEIINGSVGRNKILINLTSGTLDETVENSNGDIILKVGSGSIRLNDLYHEGVTVRDALGNLTVVKDIQGAHASYNSLDSVLFSGDYDENELLNRGTNVTIKGGSGNDHIHNNFTDNVTVDAGTGDDYIFSEGSNILFKYTEGDGNDLIYGFNETSTLQISDSTSAYATQQSGDDIIVTVGDGSVLLEGAASLETLNIVFSASTDQARQGLMNADKAKQTLTSGISVGDASARTKATRIVGNALDNTILGSAGKDTLYGKNGDDYLAGGKGNDKLYGQNGDDTLWGGVGNDTLTGGAGADTFICASGEGKDVINDFGDDDLLQITDDWTATYSASKNTIAFKVGSTASALTLKNFTATTFNINGDAYHISGTKLVK